MLNVYTSQEELTAPRFAAAFAAGCGGKITRDYIDGDWAGFGSPKTWDMMKRAIKAGHNFYYGDHAYFGRGVFYRVTKNRLQHTGIGNPDLERLKPFYEAARKWQKNGRHIVVCPQSNNHHDRFGDSQWEERIIKILKANSDRRIIVRTKKNKRPLKADLIGAFCVVTHTSNAAIEAIMRGIPAICTGDCAASIMSLSDPANVEKPFYPDYDRMDWAGVLAANQWTFDEIAAGKCWEAIK